MTTKKFGQTVALLLGIFVAVGLGASVLFM
jgi:hypothetical protein